MKRNRVLPLFLNEFHTRPNLIRKTIAEGGILRVYTKRPTRWVKVFLFFILLSYIIDKATLNVLHIQTGRKYNE